MKISRISAVLLLIVLLALFCSACGGAAGTTATRQATPGSTQGTSSRTLLTEAIVYVALGASDAVGVGTNQPAIQGYVPQIGAHLAHKSHVINLGISGIHLHEALDKELPLALASSPQLITIWQVANEFVAGVSYDSYMQDLDTLLRQLHTGTKAQMVMANLPDLTLLPSFSRLTADQKTQMRAGLQQWNSGIATVAARYNVMIVDLFGQQSQLTAHPEYVSGDGFHPSPAGYAQLTKFFLSAIEASKAS